MAKSRRKKLIRFLKAGFWRRGLKKVKAVIFPKKLSGFRARILGISIVSFLALTVIVYGEYSFWSGLEMPEKGKDYYFINAYARQAVSIKKPVPENQEKKMPPPDLKLTVVADAHVGIEIGYSGLQKFMNAMAKEKPDLVIDAGDLIESRIRYEIIPPLSAQNEFEMALGAIGRKYPVYHAVGTHELFSLKKIDIKSITASESYYNFNFKGYNIIILDANFTRDGRDVEPANAVPGAYTGFIPQKEKDWLECQLRSHNQNIIFSHHSLYNIKNLAELENILKMYKKRIIMTANGHKHRAEIRKFGGVTNYDLPSLKWQEAYSIIEIYGMSEKVSFVDLE
ncbi:MAG: metallophosphoesterase [Candidatus Moranbacteria bacterium]|nr:metallophosphoesterase [Candidatus Moranbacteria bacterium]